MFDGLDCCGYDDNDDGDYADPWEFAPGDTALCTECLCKGTLYNVILCIARNLLKTSENIKISTHSFYHRNLD
jgi:hypothetical protein